jgi:tricorn protease
MKKLITFILFMGLSGLLFSQEEACLMRFPAIYDNLVVFSYAGDLYTVASTGGVARKLTNDVGYEMFTRFSPDGKSIAFTGQYDGNTEVYLMPAQGGIPKRLTYTATLGRDDISDRMGPNNIVLTWKNNEQVVYRSRKKTFNDFIGQLFIANVNGGLSEELPLPAGGFCSYSPDGKKLAYNRVFREFRTWKYYRGGMADDIWIYDFQSKETVNITNNVSQDIIPMWHGKDIYFLSDRDRIMNLFVYNTETKETKKVTNYTEFDVKFPSLGNKSIVYENGGFIYNLDLATLQSVKIPITIADDLNSGRNELKDASKLINSWAISPDGKRMVFGARGDVFTVPAKTGMTKNLTETSGVHDRNVEWSPDGKYISYISDRTGEDEIYIQNQDGTEKAIQITSNSSNYKYNPVWSPDSKKLMWSDRMQRLQYVDISSKQIVLVEETKEGEIRTYSWSPDSKWIAYPMPTSDGMTRIYVFNTDTKEKQPLTDGWYESGDPVFSNDGKYLFFTSSRDFNPDYSWIEWNTIYKDMSKVYFLTLTKDIDNPFQPENDQVEVKAEPASDEAKKEEGKDKKEADTKEKKTEGVTVKIDFDGIMDRIVALPIDAGAYWNLSPVDKSIYYNMRNSDMKGVALKVFNLEDKKETDLGEYGSFLISANMKKMVVQDKGKYAIIDLPKGKISASEFVDLSNMKVWANVKDEWQQIYDESWRQMRDFFYDPNMHGVDWKAIHSKYKPLVAHVNNRNDLNYIIGEMIGELNIGHAYVGEGDRPAPERIKMGLLGAELSRDKSGYYKIEKILKGENWSQDNRSPLSGVGIDIKEGDFIVAVNGKSTKDMVDIYMALMGTADKQVELSINGSPDEAGARKEIIIPVGDESNLYYYNWVQDNIKKVSEATNGQVGYIHIPDMSPAGLNEFVKYFYPQLKKRALIIDDRGNGGGNVSPMIIERLKRELAMMRISRNGSPNTSPESMHYGPKVMLINNYSASDGDLFPYQFKTLKMGKLIGKRTWGGVTGIRGTLPFIDGGSLMRPEFSTYDREGKSFVIEGHGVDPDIEVDNDPAKEYAGEDQQLNKAIEVILEELKNWPEGWPDVPPYPDKSK